MWSRLAGLGSKVLGVSFVYKAIAVGILTGAVLTVAYIKGMDHAYEKAAENHEEHIALIYEQMSDAIESRDTQWENRVKELDVRLQEAQRRASRDAQLERSISAQIKSISVKTQEIQSDAQSSELGTSQFTASYSRLLNNAYTEAASSERPSTTD